MKHKISNLVYLPGTPVIKTQIPKPQISKPHISKPNTNLNSKVDSTLQNTNLVPFYIYTGSAYNFYNQCISDYGPNATIIKRFNTTDRDYKHATSFKFLEGIENHPSRTRNPENAKLFVVPALIGHVVRHSGGMNNNNKRATCKGLSAKTMIRRLSFSLSKSKYWKKNNGIDHVLVDTDFRITNLGKEFSSIKHFLRNMTVGFHVRSPIIDLNNQSGHQKGKDFGKTPIWACTVLVPMNEREIDVDTKLSFEEFEKRKFELFFMGQWDGRAGYVMRKRMYRIVTEHLGTYAKKVKNSKNHGFRYENKTTNYIYVNGNEKSNLSHCNFDNFTKTDHFNCKSDMTHWNHYPKLLGQSKFALAMSGDNAGSTRYFDAPNSGTIPIFIADQAFTDGLPFVGKVPWRDFSFFLPESSDKELKKELVAILNVDRGILRRKFEMLMRYRDEISWTRNATKVGENFLEEAWRRCVQPFVGGK